MSSAKLFDTSTEVAIPSMLYVGAATVSKMILSNPQATYHNGFYTLLAKRKQQSVALFFKNSTLH